MKVHEVVGKIVMVCTMAIIALVLATVPGLAKDKENICDMLGSTPGKPAIQLLPTIGLGVLRDCFYNDGAKYSLDSKPQLSVFNQTNATLNVLLYSKDGTKYDMKIPQGTDNKWSISPGTYRSELIIPGFPSMAGVPMEIENGHSYRWFIRRSEL